ncbi:MAG TPA: hypothetical protein PKN52_10060, partial [Trueperaceae bacterium]|nr:hypothetical protein [Trueperaceae bacterium]
MPLSRRAALHALTTVGAGLAASPALRALRALAHETADRAPHDLAADQDYWDTIRRAYDITPDFVQLENGYFSPCAREVHERYLAHLRMVNA